MKSNYCNYLYKMEKPFYLYFDKDYQTTASKLVFKKDSRVKVLRVYPRTSWRRFLTFLGFKTKAFKLIFIL